MRAFWIATGLVFLAELGDKTQLVSLAFATRFNARVVMAGVFVATLVVHVFSVVLGEGAGLIVPKFWIDLVAGLAFIAFGLWTMRGDTLDEDEVEKPSRFGPFLTVATTFFLAELGDKTMLATMTIASQERQFLPVWIGSTVGMVLADGLAIVVGRKAGRMLPERTVRYVAAAVFFVSGAYTLWSAAAMPPLWHR